MKTLFFAVLALILLLGSILTFKKPSKPTNSNGGGGSAQDVEGNGDMRDNSDIDSIKPNEER